MNGVKSYVIFFCLLLGTYELIRHIYRYALLSERTQERITSAFDEAQWWINRLIGLQFILFLVLSVNLFIFLPAAGDYYVFGSFMAVYLAVCILIVAVAYPSIALYFLVRRFYEARHSIPSQTLSGGEVEVSPGPPATHQ